MVEVDYEKLLTNYPFLTYLIYGYGSLRSTEEKTYFLKLADTWWWESNRLIPINVFLKIDWPFKFAVKTMNSKDVDIKFGPHVSLRDISPKRTKRRSITLVRKLG